MVLIVTLVISLVLWIVLWGIGAKGFDAFMLAIVLMLGASIVHIVLPMLPGNRRRSDD